MTRRRASFLVIAPALFLAACSSATNDPAPGPATTAPPVETPPTDPPATTPPPPRGVYPLGGSDLSLAPSELTAPIRVLDGADILAFGETVHTSEGYAQARVRFVRELVERHGVRAVAFESPWGPAETTRAFVERCEGTLSAARTGLTFRAWTSKATSTLLEWLCDYNRTHAGDRVTVFGFDVQNPSYDGSYLRRFFAKAAPAESARATALDACLGAKHDTMVAAAGDPNEGPLMRLEKQLPQERHDDCVAATADVRAWIVSNDAALVSASSREEVELAKFATRSLAANSGEFFFFKTNQRKSYEWRDEGMADGFDVMRSLRAPGKRVAIIAHNEHIMRKRDVVVSRSYQWKSMGSFLGERHGDKYAPVGLFAQKVSINWDGSGVEEMPVRDLDGDLEKSLHALGLPAFFLDLADNAVLEKAKSYALTDNVEGVPLDHYRALVFLEASPPYVNP